MNATLGIIGGFVGFALLIYAAKGTAGTQWQGQIAPGPVIGSLLKGDWPYDYKPGSPLNPGAGQGLGSSGNLHIGTSAAPKAQTPAGVMV